ncbi:MAG: transketolase [Phycisphaerales bacterium]|nr:transketolase [Phycisphaerales bacterium]
MPTFDQIVHAKAIQIGKLALRATTAAGSGHPTSALSLAHIVTQLMYRTMRWDPENPQHRGSDRLVLSEGHAVPIIYAACADIGVTFYPEGKPRLLTANDLMTLREISSPLDGHPNPRVGFPFFDAATGSLGQGLSVAAGLAAAAKVDHHGKSIFCIIGDAEAREGQIWEAMDFIAEHDLTSVVAIFNCNQHGQSDFVAPAQTTDTLAAKAEAFGWKALIVDGHDPTEVRNALKQRSEARVAEKPLAIIARTVKGWGAPSIQGPGHHAVSVSEQDLPKVLAELDATGMELGADAVQPSDLQRILRILPPLPVPHLHKAQRPASISEMAENQKLSEALETAKKLSPRRGFGLALSALGHSNPNVVGLDADMKNSTYSADFARHHQSHFFECRIAEQNMVSVAVGIAAGGKIPVASTFGKFLSRATNQIEMAILSGANIKLVGTHVGVTIGADGPSQMALTDVAFFRGMAHVTDHRGGPAITILTASDAVSAYVLTLEMVNWPSACYLRALRSDVPVLYQEHETFPFGKFKVLRKAMGTGKKLVIAACGYMVHSALKAAEELHGQNIEATVVDAYSLPMDTDELLQLAAAEGGAILTVEDCYTGGIGSEIAEAVARMAKNDRPRVESMAVRNLPKSGKTPEDVLAYCHLAVSDIVDKAKGLVG